MFFAPPDHIMNTQLLEPLGAFFDGQGTTFRVWAEDAQAVAVRIGDKEVALLSDGRGHFSVRVPWARPGMLYAFRVGDEILPDPYARFLPNGVHGAAEIFQSTYEFRHPRSAIDLRKAQCIYEIHIGTFTPEGTYVAAQEKLDLIADLGVTAIELMPLAAFRGARGWGYDGTALFAPFAGYGRPEDLCRFIDAAHARHLSVIIDVVLNHFGPDGNYLSAYAKSYFDEQTQTAWGAAPAYAEPHMRALALGVIEHWLETYRFDGIRLDATHAIVDRSAPHLLADIAKLAHRHGAVVFAEDDRNEPALITEIGLDGIWADDLHHAIHVALTGEQDGYYAQYRKPTMAESATLIARAISNGWLRGKPKGDISHAYLITCLQNHDQVGNRALGERLSTLVTPNHYAAASLVSLLLPTTPLLFMGQEWGASTPFLYFTDHDEPLGKLIVEGRRKEFSKFRAFADPAQCERIPSPQDAATARSSTLRWEERERGRHAEHLALHRSALALRKHDPVFSQDGAVLAEAHGATIRIVRRSENLVRVITWNLGATTTPWKPQGRLLMSSGKLTSEGLPPGTAIVEAIG